MDNMVNAVKRGSPPPMRGKDKEGRNIDFAVRITPAYAGKSCGTGFVRNAERDHPRLCGEKTPVIASPMEDASFESAGSPPPMRGKVIFRKVMRLRLGITPAYAGKSLHLRDSSREK